MNFLNKITNFLKINAAQIGLSAFIAALLILVYQFVVGFTFDLGFTVIILFFVATYLTSV